MLADVKSEGLYVLTLLEIEALTEAWFSKPGLRIRMGKVMIGR